MQYATQYISTISEVNFPPTKKKKKPTEICAKKDGNRLRRMAASDDDGYMKSSTKEEPRWPALRMSSVSACSSNQRAQRENIGRELRWANRTVRLLVTASRGAASLLPLMICTTAPPMGRKTLLLLVPLYCECPGAIWHHSAVRWAVIQPGLADCQCRGPPLLMHIVVVVVVVGRGGFFISSFSGRATGESALNLSVMLLTFNVFHGPADCSLQTGLNHLVFRALRCEPLNLKGKHLSAYVPACHFDCISVCFLSLLDKPRTRSKQAAASYLYELIRTSLIR